MPKAAPIIHPLIQGLLDAGLIPPKTISMTLPFEAGEPPTMTTVQAIPQGWGEAAKLIATTCRLEVISEQVAGAANSTSDLSSHSTTFHRIPDSEDRVQATSHHWRDPNPMRQPMRNDTPYRLLCRALMQSIGLPADEAISASIGSVDGFAVLQATFPIPLDKIEKVLPIDSGLHGGKFGVVSTPSLRPASALPVDSESQSSETQPPNPEGWCSGRVDG